jgi:N6-L-threonylcarbamoyladenine synthase
MKRGFLGLDTSNYRTSISIIDEGGEILFEKKELIPVAAGKRGAMQSEALFHHIKRLPELLIDLTNHVQVLAIAASTKPRPIEGSYMPVFLCGESIGKFCAKIMGIPFYETSHQEGHIAAAEYSLGMPISANRFLAVHLSGGTSELLAVERTDSGYQIGRLGGTLDLHAGQLIDRIGVFIGLPFPAGPHLERLAKKAKGGFSVPSSVKGLDFSFSGPESALLRALEHGIPHEEVARAAEQVISNTLEKVIRKAIDETGIKQILFVGGVASNLHIKERLMKRLEHPAVKASLYFTSPEYSGDNAYGVACIARKRFIYEH